MQLSSISLAITRLGAGSSTGPSLDLDFTSGTLDSRVTFVRASNATRVNSAGLIELLSNDAPRFDYNPATLAAQGLLVEEQRTNLLTYSKDFNTGGVWNKTNTTVTVNTVTSPSGAVDGSTLTGSATNAEHRLFQNITTSNAITLSIFAKKGTHDFLQIRTQNISSGFVNFDLNLGTLSATTATGKIENFGNGWFRCTANFPAFLITNISYNLVTSLASIRAETNTVATSLSIFGAQLENGTFSTSYIPTTAAQATRAADVVTITGTNFSSWYRQDEGSLYAEVVYNGQLTGSSLETNSIFLDDGSADNRFSIRTMRDTSSALADVSVVSGTVSQMDTTGVAVSTGVVYKRAFAFALNNAIPCVNGVLDGTTDTSFTVPVGVNRLAVDSTTSALYVRRLSFYPRRLINSELQSITT
jgi:hypothetical protein